MGSWGPSQYVTHYTEPGPHGVPAESAPMIPGGPARFDPRGAMWPAARVSGGRGENLGSQKYLYDPREFFCKILSPDHSNPGDNKTLNATAPITPT